jgi:hypothetical protein
MPSSGRSPRAQRLAPAVVRDYLEGTSQAELAKEYGLGLSTVTAILDREGIERRPLYLAHARKYPVNHAAFANTTNESAYWIGFVMADGCIVKNNGVEVSSHVRDAAHLKRFLAFIGSPGRPLRQQGKMVVACAYSPELVADLARNGVVPRKSLGAEASPQLARRSSFWLGMIDGDGTVGVSRAPYIALCGSRPLMQQYRVFLETRVLDWAPRIFQRDDGLCIVSVEGESARRLAQCLDGSSPVRLERKALSARRVLSYRSSRTPDDVFSSEPRVRWREARKLWQGTQQARSFHVAQLRDLIENELLPANGVTTLHRWKPSPRSSMVAYAAVVADSPALIWATARWRTLVPESITSFAGPRPVFVLHVSPAHPDLSVLQRATRGGASVVGLEALRKIARKAYSMPSPLRHAA